MKKLLISIGLFIVFATSITFVTVDAVQTRDNKIGVMRTEIAELPGEIELYLSDTHSRFERLEVDNAGLLICVKELRDELRSQ